MSRATILEDDRQIYAIFFPADGEIEASSISIADRQIRIEAYGEPGPHGLIPYLRCIDVCEGTVFKRVPAWMVVINYAPRQHLFTPDATGECIHCGYGQDSFGRSTAVCVDRPKAKKRRAQPQPEKSP